MKRVLKKQNPNITIELTKTTKKEKIQAIVGIVIIAAAIVLIKFWR